MQYPQVLIFEHDGRLAAQLEPFAEARRWTIRQPRQVDACIRLLRHARPGILVVKVGRDLGREFTLLERVGWLCPDARRIVVGDINHPALAGLAWHLGVDFVLMPPQPRELLPSIIAGFAETDGQSSAGQAASHD